jgi:hypothetical protein
MTFMNKPLSAYIQFQKRILILILVVGFLRLALSLAGVPNSTVKWLSVTAVAMIGIIYCAIKVPRTGFGTYRHLFPLYWVQAVIGNSIICGAIVLAILTGTDNIYSVPEYSPTGDGRTWFHVMAHALDGLFIGPVFGWLIGSAIMFVFKKLSGSRSAIHA